jgi:Kef-type K+ transport system membrane component KefB
MPLCDYKDIFGKPNEGVHKHRLFGVAIVDVILTMLIGFFISYQFNHSLFDVLVLLFIIGIISHQAFCVRTTVDKFLFK